MLIAFLGFAFAKLGLEQECVLDRDLFAGRKTRRDLDGLLI